MITHIISTRNDNTYHKAQEMITRIKTQENSRSQSQEIQKTQDGKNRPITRWRHEALLRVYH